MTDHGDNQQTRPEWDGAHALSGAYAVDALDDIERARFEEHLRGCAECRTEVETLRETAAALAFDPVDPPAALRAEVLAGIATIRPVPPLTQPGSDRVLPDKSRRRPWLFGTGPMLVAAALVLVALATAVWVQPWADDEPALTATEEVLADPDAQRVTEALPDGAEVTFVVSESEGRAVLLADDLPLAPEGKVYELWLETPQGTLLPAGLVPDEKDATVLLEGDAGTATGAAISVEPDGGSEQPTTVIAFVDLPA